MVASLPDALTRQFAQNPHDTGFVADPWKLYAGLHAFGGPVFWKDYGLWCVTAFESVDGILRDRRFGRVPSSHCEAKAYPDHLAAFAATEAFSLLNLEPPGHTRVRRLVNRAFVSRQVRSMAPGIRKLANDCIDSFIEHGRTELLASYATPIPATIIARLVGIPEEETASLLEWSHAMVRVYTLTQTVAEEVLANQAARDFSDRLQVLINAKRRQPGDDLVSHLLAQADGDEPLGDAAIISIVILLLNAGHEATVHQLGNAVHTLLRPGASTVPVQSLFHSPEQTEATVGELLRHGAPLHLFTRYALEMLDLGCGVTLKSGEQVALLLGAANRDPVRFKDPDRFDPGRPDGGHVTLGGGIHYCVGAQLAKLELGIALATLFERLPTLRLEAEPVFRDSFHFHGLESLPVTW
mgnify:CR=1 FL=1